MSQPPTLRETAFQETEAMVRYLLAAGKPCPAAAVRALEEAERGAVPEVRPLLAAHAQLARLVAPATPAAILMLDGASRGGAAGWSTLGTVRLVRQMMGVAIGCVVLFVALSLFRSVGEVEVDLAHTAGGRLLLNELFWMAAAGMGASFAMLFQVNQFITERTYDPAYAPSYWIKLLLGVIAGFILVALLPLPEPDPAAAAGGAAAGAVQTFTRPLLAMLGGFSASAVYGILTRLVEWVENLFAGSAKEQASVREAAAAQRAGAEAAEGRIAVAGKLVRVQQQLAGGGSPEELSRRLQEVIDALVGTEGEGEPAAEEGVSARVPALALVGDPTGEDGEPAG